LDAQSVWQRGLSPPWLSWLPTPSACRCPPLEWRAQRGKAGPLSQAAAVGAAGVGEQPGQRTRMALGPEG